MFVYCNIYAESDSGEVSVNSIAPIMKMEEQMAYFRKMLSISKEGTNAYNGYINDNSSVVSYYNSTDDPH
jgi:hypothetical protein